jgi:hypothetical protein
MQRWNFLAEQVKAVIKDYPMLKLTQGRKVSLVYSFTTLLSVDKLSIS